MVANTAKLCIEIENQADLTYGDNGVTSEDGDQGSDITTYEIKNIDFGLALRPETKLNIQTEVNQITLSKNNGQDVVLNVYMDDEGNIVSDRSGLTDEAKANMTEEEITELEEALKSKITSQRKITEIQKPNLATGTQGFKYVAVEASYVQGMTVNIKYKLTVYNNSDVEYVGTSLATIKNAQSIYNLATKYESGGDYSELDFQNSPFSTGKGIVYGKYTGLHYYTGVIAKEGTDNMIDNSLRNTYLPKRYYEGEEANILAKDVYKKDVVVTTTIDQLVDFIDNDISKLDENSTGGRVINHAWDDSTYQDLYYKLSNVAYKDNKKIVENKVNLEGLTDNKDVPYVAAKASEMTKDEHDIINGELSDVSRNNVVFSHNMTMTTSPVYVGYKRMATATDESDGVTNNNSRQTTNDTNTQNAVAAQEVVDGTEGNNASTVIDISTNLVPRLEDRGMTTYTVSDDSATTSAIDSTNILLSVELNHDF